ncbi:MAG: diacylglycerol kinase family protein, partial [Bacteroidota bacterium]
GAMTPLVLDPNISVKEYVGRMLREGKTEFIAAGGDGTVNLLLESLMEQAPSELLPRVKVGAIGLGSSNDFHKPFQGNSFIGGVPAKVDFGSTIYRDVGLLTYEDEAGDLCKRYWLVNASIGITAEANLFFNSPDSVLRFLKRSSTESAILYAALHTIATYHNRPMTIMIGDYQPFQTRVTNLGIVKSPHFSGNFCYDSDYEPNSGYFYVHLCENMSLRRTLTTLWRLSRKKFSGFPLTHSWRANRIAVRSAQPFAVEFDGEVIKTRFVSFSLKHKLIQVCTC